MRDGGGRTCEVVQFGCCTIGRNAEQCNFEPLTYFDWTLISIQLTDLPVARAWLTYYMRTIREGNDDNYAGRC